MNLNKFIDETILKRGLSYFKKDYVSEPEEVSANQYETTVHGTEDYTVNRRIAYLSVLIPNVELLSMNSAGFKLTILPFGGNEQKCPYSSCFIACAEFLIHCFVSGLRPLIRSFISLLDWNPGATFLVNSSIAYLNFEDRGLIWPISIPGTFWNFSNPPVWHMFHNSWTDLSYNGLSRSFSPVQDSRTLLFFPSL